MGKRNRFLLAPFAGDTYLHLAPCRYRKDALCQILHLYRNWLFPVESTARIYWHHHWW